MVVFANNKTVLISVRSSWSLELSLKMGALVICDPLSLRAVFECEIFLSFLIKYNLCRKFIIHAFLWKKCATITYIVLLFYPTLLSTQTLTTANPIPARTEARASTRSTPLFVFVCRATEEPRVRKVTVGRKPGFALTALGNSYVEKKN